MTVFCEPLIHFSSEPAQILQPWMCRMTLPKNVNREELSQRRGVQYVFRVKPHYQTFNSETNKKLQSAMLSK